MSIRVALIIPTLDRSGAEKQLTLLATGLPRPEFEVHVILLTRSGPYQSELDAAGIPVTLLKKRLKADPLAWWKLRQTLAAIRPQIAHSWLFAAHAYMRLAAGAGVQRIVSERCVDSWKAGWQLRLDRWLIDRTDWLTGNSQSVVDFYHQHGFPIARSSVIPNGIEPPVPSRLTRAEFLRRADVPEDAYVVMAVGRLAPQKRVADLIWAVEILRQIRPQLRLVIVGDGPERARLERLAHDVHAQDFVRFVGHQPVATDWLAHANAYWIASGFEGMSNSLMEAMSLGLPVVASNIPANRELVQHEVTGLLAQAEDPVAYMQFTRRLIDEPDLGSRLGAAARQHMMSNYSVAAMVERYANLYRSLISPRGVG